MRLLRIPQIVLALCLGVEATKVASANVGEPEQGVADRAGNVQASSAEAHDDIAKRLQTMSAEELREILTKQKFSDDQLFELVGEAEFQNRNELAEILVDAGGRVFGRDAGIDGPEAAERHYQLFRRFVKVAQASHAQVKLDLALADSYRWGGSPRYTKEALAAGAQIIHRTTFGDTLLMELWVTEAEMPEVVECYAQEVLNHGPRYELAAEGGFDELLAAAYMGDHARVVEEIRKNGAKQKDKWGKSALIWACSSPHSNDVLIEGLLRAGLQLGDGSDQNPSALVAAIKHKRFDLASILVKAGAIGQLGGEPRELVLFSSLNSGNDEYAKACVAAGLRMTKADACRIYEGLGRSGNRQLLKAVQEASRVSGLSQEDIQPALNVGLVAAVMSKSGANIQLFWNLGARIVPGARHDGSIMDHSALTWAAQSIDERVLEQVVDLAIQQGFLGTIEHESGVTVGEEAMVSACRFGNKALVDKLLASGVVPTGKGTPGGTTLLCAAARSGSIELVRMFLDRGFDVNGEDLSRDTPIISAMNSKWTPELITY